MENKPITDRELEQAEECRLVEPDGTSWEVLRVTMENGLAWVRAKRPAKGTDASESTGTDDVPPGRLRVFDTVLSPKARLVWELPDGRSVEARGAADGDLVWDVRSRRDAAEQDRGTDPGDLDREVADGDRTGDDSDGFFQDAFLAY